MKKRLVLGMLLALSAGCHAAGKPEAVYTGPDCSKDTGKRIFGGLWDSFFPEESKYHKYMNAIAGKNTTLHIVRLSSEKINKKDSERLMLRSAKRDGYDGNDKDLKPGGGRYGMYMDGDIYRQYYLIESNKGFKAIAEYYSSIFPGKYPAGSKDGESCGNDLENIYIISETVYGHTSDFATN